MLLVQVKKYYEETTGEEIDTKHYSSLGISPVHIHKNKVCHKLAILALGNDIVQQIRQNRGMMVEYARKVQSEEIAIEH